MRPDQHKKKKNDQYKKKHNIKADESKNSNGKSGHEEAPASAPVKSQQSNDDVKRIPLGRQQGQQKVIVSDVDEYAASVQPVFRKRALESNWERYEGLPPEDDDDAEMRGADFQALLEATSSSVSQFQFEDEKDWVMDSGNNEEADCDGWITIDVNDLSAAMLTIPLHERLNIPTDLFQEEQIKEFESSAARHLANYNAASMTTRKHAEEEARSKVLVNLVDSAPQNKTEKQQQQQQQQKSDVLDDIFIAGGSGLGDRAGLTSPSCVAAVEQRRAPITSEQDNDVEDDLDVLLSGTVQEVKPIEPTENVCVDISTPSTSFSESEPNETETMNPPPDKPKYEEEQELSELNDFVKKKVNPSNLEDALEDLLNLECPVQLSKPAVAVETNELDDWLDSVLDD